MVDWYKTFSDMQRGDDGAAIGEVTFSRRMFKYIALLLLLVSSFHAIRLWSGSVSWFGMEERNVRAAPEWMHTPVSTNLLSDSFGLSLPLFALKGQEIVIQYRLSSAQQKRNAPYAGLMLSCLCAVRNYGHFKIEEPGTGVITFPVPETNLYTVRITQSVGPAGEASIGSYYWGVKS